MRAELSIVTSFLGALLLASRSLLGVDGLHCFQCYSLEGSDMDCEDDFGPYNRTGHLLQRDCRVGYFSFSATYCVKIKATRPDGQLITLRTCSREDWGSQCGTIYLETDDQPAQLQSYTGCVASCEEDGCNTAGPLTVPRQRYIILTSLLLLYDVLNKS